MWRAEQTTMKIINNVICGSGNGKQGFAPSVLPLVIQLGITMNTYALLFSCPLTQRSWL